MTGTATVNDFMATKLITVAPDADIHQVIKLLLKKRISGVLVLDEKGGLVGILSRKDCLKVVFSANYHHDWGGRVSEYMSGDVQTIESGTDIVKAAGISLKKNFRRFPVVDKGRLVGIISRVDILGAIEKLW